MLYWIPFSPLFYCLMSLCFLCNFPVVCYLDAAPVFGTFPWLQSKALLLKTHYLMHADLSLRLSLPALP